MLQLLWQNVLKSDEQGQDGLSKIKHIIAVSSCKGGVGKSTVAVNLAYSLHAKGLRVGLFDADIYGPSLPTMVQVQDPSPKVEGQTIHPIDHFGVKLMSFGLIQHQMGQEVLP